ncbi:MAG TPA: hypothetical protein VF374_00820, partial [Thermoplasmata archaeon]
MATLNTAQDMFENRMLTNAKTIEREITVVPRVVDCKVHHALESWPPLNSPLGTVTEDRIES